MGENEPIPEKKPGFWRRMTASKGLVTTASPTTFNEFAEGQEDVWGDEEDPFEGVNLSRLGSVGSTSQFSSASSSRATSRPTSTQPIKQPIQQQPPQPQQQPNRSTSPSRKLSKSPQKSDSNLNVRDHPSNQTTTQPAASTTKVRRSFLTKSKSKEKDLDKTKDEAERNTSSGSRFRLTSSAPSSTKQSKSPTLDSSNSTGSMKSKSNSTMSATTNPNASTATSPTNSNSNNNNQSNIANSTPVSSSLTSQPSVNSADTAHRVEKFTKLLSSQNLDLDALRDLSYTGIPFEQRPDTWRLLSGYLPANIDRREATLKRKRSEYQGFVDQYYGTRNDEGEMKKTFHQIEIDIKRTNPKMPSFHNPITHECFQRILYIWAIRHPASGYVQGINELVTPFMTVFLSSFTGNVDECDASTVSEEARNDMEADSYWCLTKLLDGIQDNYTSGQPGIQKKLLALQGLVCRVDKPLHDQLEKHGIQYVQFAFRWMNCILMREVPLQCSIRLWDTYHSEIDGFVSLHMYTCAAFLVMFSKQLLACPDFQEIIMTLQKLPTESWTHKEIALMVAEAYRWKVIFHDTK